MNRLTAYYIRKMLGIDHVHVFSLSPSRWKIFDCNDKLKFECSFDVLNVSSKISLTTINIFSFRSEFCGGSFLSVFQKLYFILQVIFSWLDIFYTFDLWQNIIFLRNIVLFFSKLLNRLLWLSFRRPDLFWIEYWSIYFLTIL